MIRMSITYLERRTAERDRDDFPTRYHLHADRETVEAVPTFLELRERFGRCEGKVYRDTAGGAIHCGYIFAKRERWYDNSIGWDDPRQFYTAETWVSFESVAVTPVDIAHAVRVEG